MKKKTFRYILLLFVLMTFITTGCKKTVDQDKDSNLKLIQKEEENLVKEIEDPEADKEENKEKAKEKIKNLPLVEGAVFGSASTYVVDRQLWKNFDMEGQQNAAKKVIYGFHLPKILLDSPDAKSANEQIEELASHLIDLYEENKEYMADDEINIQSSFSVYEDENILSVYIESYNIWESYNTKNLIFNFSLPDGKFLADNELLAYFGLEDKDILSTMEASIVQDYSTLAGDFDKNVDDYSFIYNMENLLGLVFNDFWDSYGKKDRVYIDELGNPMFIYYKLAAYEGGNYEGPAKLLGKALNSSEYLDEYVKMARILGVDLEDESNKGFMILLGYANNEDDLKDILGRLYPWQEAFSQYKDPAMLLAVSPDPEFAAPDLIGQEYYLFVPKYKNTSIRLKELELGNDGNLEEVDNYILDSYSVTGPTLICQNISEIVPNAKIVLRHRDDVFEFSPSISLKDGSIVLPEEILDGQGVLDWDSLVNEYYYSPLLFERLLSFIGRG